MPIHTIVIERIDYKHELTGKYIRTFFDCTRNT